MKHIVTFSGGADSEAVLIWAVANLTEFDVVFCDTGHELPPTMKFIQRINREYLEDKLIILKSSKYDGMHDMAKKKGRYPSSKARFCTEELKVKPMIDYVKQFKGEKRIYQGIRWDESIPRSKLPKEVFAEEYNGTVIRPLIDWTKQQVFDYIKQAGWPVNPLYKRGFFRVGCGPCVQGRLAELRQIKRLYPEVIANLIANEAQVGCSFFAQDKIPQRFRTWTIPGKEMEVGRKYLGTFSTCDDPNCDCEKEDYEPVYGPMVVGSIQDVVTYVMGPENQMELFEDEDRHAGCLSTYGLCE